MSAPIDYLGLQVFTQGQAEDQQEEGDLEAAKIFGDLNSLACNAEKSALAVKILAAINELRSEEGASVEVLCSNPDFNKQPNEKISVNAWFTGFEDRTFAGATLLACLEAAVVEKLAHQAEKGTPMPPLPPPRSPIEAMFVLTSFRCPKCGKWNDLKQRKKLAPAASEKDAK